MAHRSKTPPPVRIDLPTDPVEREAALNALVDDLALLMVLRHLAAGEKEGTDDATDQEFTA